MIDKIRNYAKEAGREPQSIGIEGRISYGQGMPDAWQKDLEAWKYLGATHVSFNTMKSGLNVAVGAYRSDAAICLSNCGKLTSRIGRYYLTAKDTKITKFRILIILTPRALRGEK